MQLTNNTQPPSLRIPFIDGVIVEIQSGYEHILNDMWEPLTYARNAFNAKQNPILLSDYIDNVIDRRIRESACAPKQKTQLKSRSKKIKELLTRTSESRKASSLSLNDTYILTNQLHSRLERSRTESNQGETLKTYYRLFNYIANEAFKDGLIPLELKISCNNNNKATATLPFNERHLTNIFGGWMYRDYNIHSHKINHNADSWKFWLIPLGLFSGARLNELCQLRNEDITNDENGITMIHINNFGFDKAVKTDDSIRYIPVHQKLIDMGFIQFHNERIKASGPRGLLFPELKHNSMSRYSRTPSRFFSGKSKGQGYLGLVDEDLKQSGWSYRSLRRTFADCLKKNGVPLTSIATLLGHMQVEAKTTSDHYIGEPHSCVLQRTLGNGLKFNIDLSNVHWKNFKPLYEGHLNRKTRGRAPS